MKDILEQAGLTKGEAAVYIALLKLGETTTGGIIKESQISSGKVYEILNRLEDKGLAAHTIKSRTKFFTAATPNRILDYLEEQRALIQEREKKLKTIIPTLTSLAQSARKENEVRLYRGVQGVRTAIKEAQEELSSKDTVLAMGVSSNKSQTINNMWRLWHKEREQNKIRCKLLCSDERKYVRELQKFKFTETRILKTITPAAIDIIGPIVLIFAYEKEPSCTIIRNEATHATFVSFFDSLWTAADKLY